MNSLADLKCAEQAALVSPEEKTSFLEQLSGWNVAENRLEKDFDCGSFQDALSFVELIGTLADKEGHHPDILIHNLSKVKIMLTTHSVNGLSKNDFILAAKIAEVAEL